MTRDYPSPTRRSSSAWPRTRPRLFSEIGTHGIRQLPGSAAFVVAAQAAGVACAVVASSSDRGVILEAAGLGGLSEHAVDGRVRKEHGLRSKPAPDTFLAGAKPLHAAPRHAAVFEDALSGSRLQRAAASSS